MITLLTSNIHQKISGGTIYNSQLLDVLEKHDYLVSLEITTTLDAVDFHQETTYLIDGILIDSEFDLKRLKNGKVFFLIHLWPSKNPALSASTRESLMAIEKEICQDFQVIVTGKSSLDYLTETLGQSTKNTMLLPPGIPNNWLSKKTYPKLPEKMLYLSNFIEGKGHNTLLEVVAKLKNEKITIDCYGEILSETYWDNFNRFRQQHKLNNIHYKGVVNYTQINALLLEYDLLLHFSEYESFGMSCMEALASGLPILITPTGNFETYTALGVKGILTGFETEEACAQLQKIISSESYYQEHIDALVHFKYASWEETFKPLRLLLKL
jgi:glycosyltransferase involved in cell wall biosynthesis